ncbi:nitroreductase family protein [Bizionia sp. KMM 8389]
MKTQENICLENIAETDFEIFALLKQRYSPRVFKKETVKPIHLNQLFEAVRWSASSNNLQPWRFIHARKGTQAYQDIFNCLSEFNQSWASNAPILMLAIYKELDNSGKENFHALHDLGLGLGAMTVQAQYLGIGLHHMAGLNWRKAHDNFKVPQGFHVTSAIALGYYGGDLELLPSDLEKDETASRNRKPQKEFVFKNTWGQ